MPERVRRATRRVDEGIFRAVYDSPRSLPGRHQWVTSDDDVREIERVLGLPAKAIGAPLWVSGDSRNCKACGRETNWLDIVTSGLARAHSRQMIASVILGNQRFVNVEVPRAIAGLVCVRCQAPITDLRSFKCHNWAYAVGELAKVVAGIREMSRGKN